MRQGQSLPASILQIPAKYKFISKRNVQREPRYLKVMGYLEGSSSNVNAPLGGTGQVSLCRNVSEIKCNEKGCPTAPGAHFRRPT